MSCGASIPPKGHLPALDGLRGVAILAVILFHYTRQPDGSALASVYTGVVKSGWVGVDLFFVLSGFLITRILLQTKHQPHYFRNFYARRALRLFPVFYLYLFGVTVLLPVLLPNDGDVARYSANAPWHWAYLSNVLRVVRGDAGPNTHLWSLAVEEQFYAVWPVLVLLLSRGALLKACVAVIVSALTFRLGAVVLLEGEALMPWLGLLPARAGALAMGGMLAVIATDNAALARARTAAPYVTAGVLAVLLAASIPLGRLDLRSPLIAGPGLTLVALGCSGILLLTLTAPPHTLLRRVGSSPVLTTVGKYSYCMYVVHILVADALSRLIPRLPTVYGSEIAADLLGITLATMATFGVAWGSWHLWERHWLKLKVHFEARTGAPERADRRLTTAGIP